MNNSLLNSFCWNSWCHFCILVGPCVKDHTGSLVYMEVMEIFKILYVFHLLNCSPNVSELATCSRNPSATIYLPGLMLIPQNQKKKKKKSPPISISSRWELIWFCVSLSPHIPGRGDELEWEYPSQFHSCDTFQITGGGNAGHYENHLPQEAVILGLSCSWQGRRSPSGSNRINLNIPFNIAQHECRWALGTETLAWSWLFWGQSKVSPLRTFVLRAVLLCVFFVVVIMEWYLLQGRSF